MTFLKSAIALTLTTTLTVPADELNDTLKALKDNYARLEGYEATYEANTSDGKSGHISIGVDFKSGWAYLFSELKDADGNTVQKGEQWATGDNLYIIQSGDEIVVFKGFTDLSQRMDQLSIALAPASEDAPPPSRVNPTFHLDTNDIRMGIANNSGAIRLISSAEKIIAKDNETVRLDLAELGELVVDSQSGTLVSQVIKTPEKIRSFKRLTYQANPGKEAITGKFKLDFKDAPKRDIREAGFVQDMIRSSFQNDINRAGTDQEFLNKLGPRLEATEGKFLTFLSSEALNKSGFVKDDFLFTVLDQATARTAQKLQEQDQKATAMDLLTTPKTRNNLTLAMSDLFIGKAPAQKKKQYLAEILNGELTSEKPNEIAAQKLIEDFLERIYYQIRISRGIDRYIKILKGE